jgi:hypothetical protein
MWSDKSIIHGEGTFENEFHIMWDGITSSKKRSGGGTPRLTHQRTGILSLFLLLLINLNPSSMNIHISEHIVALAKGASNLVKAHAGGLLVGALITGAGFFLIG